MATSSGNGSGSKRALVTGASCGIGEEFATQLAKAGWSVTVVARSGDKLATLVAALPGSGHQALTADLATQAGCDAVKRELEAGKYQLLVNNAGVGVYGRFTDADLTQLRGMTQLNMDSLYELAHAYLKQAQSGDALVNVASTLGFMSFPGAALYAATKAFVISLSDALWFENKDRGVFVMCLSPGVTKTNFHAAAGGAADQLPPEAITQTSAQVVNAAMTKLSRRKQPTVVPGGINKTMLFFTRLMSRKGIAKMMGGNAPAGTL